MLERHGHGSVDLVLHVGKSVVIDVQGKCLGRLVDWVEAFLHKPEIIGKDGRVIDFGTFCCAVDKSVRRGSRGSELLERDGSTVGDDAKSQVVGPVRDDLLRKNFGWFLLNLFCILFGTSDKFLFFPDTLLGVVAGQHCWFCVSFCKFFMIPLVFSSETKDSHFL